jgi:hypothetical protein
MHAKKKTEKPLKWFILPNESYKGTSSSTSTRVRSLTRRPLPNAGGLKSSVMTALIKAMSSRAGDENSEAVTVIERQSATLVSNPYSFFALRALSAADGNIVLGLVDSLGHFSVPLFLPG